MKTVPADRADAGFELMRQQPPETTLATRRRFASDRTTILWFGVVRWFPVSFRPLPRGLILLEAVIHDLIGPCGDHRKIDRRTYIVLRRCGGRSIAAPHHRIAHRRSTLCGGLRRC